MEEQVQAQVFCLDWSSKEEQSYNRTVLPPDYVSLRQLREQRLKEEKEKRKVTERMGESDGITRLPQNHAPLWQLKERCLQEEKEIEMERGREKETDHCAQTREEREKTKGKGREEEESESRPLLPPNYVSLRLLREQRLKEQKEKENEKEKEKEEERVKRKMKGKAKEIEEEEEENNSLLPPNYVSLRHLKELRLQENKEKGAEEEAQKVTLRQIKTQEKGDESGEIEVKVTEKTSDRPRNMQFRKPDKRGHMQSSWVWQPVLIVADTSTDAGAPSANSVFLPDNAGLSHEVVVTLSDQNIDSDKKPKSKSDMKKWKEKKKNEKTKKHSRKKTSGKNKDEGVKGPEGPMEATGLKIGQAASASTSGKEVMLSQENDTINKKGGNASLAMSSGQSIPVCVDIKGFNGAQLTKFKKRNSRGKGKNKFVNLSVQGHNLIPTSKVEKGSDGVEEVIGFKIKDGKDEKGKRKMVNVPQPSDQTPISEEEKRAPGEGEVIGSQIESCQEKVGGENVDLPEPSKFGDRVGGNRMKRKVAKESDGVEELIGFRNKDGKDEKGKREMVNVPQPSDQTPINEEEKGAPGVGEVIGSQTESCQEKVEGKNVDLPEPSKFGDRVGGYRMKRIQAAGFRGMSHLKAGRFTARPAEHLKKEGSFMWVPKKSS